MAENLPNFGRRQERASGAQGAEELVDACLISLRRAVPEASPERDRRRAFEILVGWARLLRMRPELLARLDRDGLLGRAQRLISTRGRALVELALRVAPPARWIEEAGRLAASYEELVEPAWRTKLASRLVARLDDLELICYAAGRFGGRSRDLEKRRDACRGWMAERSTVFLAAGQVARLTRGAIREDLPALDAELSRSAEKYAWIEDALHRAQAELTFSGQLPLDSDALSRLSRAGGGEAFFAPRGEAPRLAEPWRWPQETWTRVAAATGGEPSGPWFRWGSPDRTLLARLMVDHASGGRIRVEFLGSDDDRRPATRLAGEPVRLAGVTARIDEQGVAFFLPGELQAQARPGLALEVGQRQSPWLLQAPPGSPLPPEAEG